jgi:hypothetical protein
VKSHDNLSLSSDEFVQKVQHHQKQQNQNSLDNNINWDLGANSRQKECPEKLYEIAGGKYQ